MEPAEVFIQEKQQAFDAEELKVYKEKIFEKILLNGNGDVDKDLGVYFWKTQDDLEEILIDVINKDLESLQKSWQDVMSENPETIQVVSPYRGELRNKEKGTRNKFLIPNS